jgi:hypothetical protein
LITVIIVWAVITDDRGGEEAVAQLSVSRDGRGESGGGDRARPNG